MDDKIKVFKENMTKAVLREGSLILIVGLAYYFNYLAISKAFINDLAHLLMLLFMGMVLSRGVVLLYCVLFKKTFVIPFEQEIYHVGRITIIVSILSLISLFK